MIINPLSFIKNLFKKEPEKVMKFRIGEGLTPEQKTTAQRKIQQLATPLKPIGGNLFKETIKQFPAAFEKTIREPEKAFEQYLFPIQEKRLAQQIEQNKPLPSFGRLFAEELGKNIGITTVTIGRELAKIPFKIIKTYQYFGQPVQPKWEFKFLGEVESYPQTVQRKIEEYIKKGIPEDTAVAAGILGVGGEAIIDVVILSSWIKSGLKAVQRGYSVQIQEKMAAWKLLGEPKDAVMARKNFYQLSHQFHPDKMGGSGKTQALINNAYTVLNKGGLPTTIELLKARTGIVAGKALSPISKIMELPRPIATLPFPKLPERAGYIPVEMYRAKTIPFGLSIEPIPMKPVKIPKVKGLKEELGFILKGKPKTTFKLTYIEKLKLLGKEPATTQQIKQAHAIAKSKLMITDVGKVKPQYRALAEGITGKKTMKEMTEVEAEDFVNALEKIQTRYIGGKEMPPIIPKTKAIVPEDFFKREFNEPTLAKFITPSDTYARSLGVYDLLEPLIKGRTKMEIESSELFRWLDKMESKVLNIEKVPEYQRIVGGIVNKPTTAHIKWFDLLDKHTTAKEAGLKGVEANIFTELRGLTDTMLDRANEIRTKAGLDPIKSLNTYVTHIRDVFGNAQLREKYPFPEEIKYWLDYINPKHIYNPTALHRIVKEPDNLMKDPFRALKAMVSMDLKQIYLEYPNFLFREQMKALKGIVPASTRKWAEAYVREVIKGQPTQLDQMTNETLNKLGVIKVMDIILKPFGRRTGVNPSKEIVNSISRLVHDATIWGRAKLVIRNLTQRFLTLGLYDTKSFIKGLLPMNKELKVLIQDSDFWKISNRQFLEALPKGAFGKLERIGFVPYGKSHVSNVESSMKTAYHASMELVRDPKYAKLGWTIDDVIKEMDFGANTTQYWYNLMGMPEIYRSGGTRLLGVLQTWWQNYTMKYWREMIVRAFTGKTGWGKEIPVKWRVGAARHIITSILFAEGVRRAFGLDYSRVALLGVFPSYMSPPGQIAVGLYNYALADTDAQKKRAKNQILQSWKAFIPGSMAWKDYIKAWETGNLKELFFYIDKKPDKGMEWDIDWEKELEFKAPTIDWEKELAK